MRYEIDDVLRQTAVGITHSYALTRCVPYINKHDHPTTVLVWTGGALLAGLLLKSPPAVVPGGISAETDQHTAAAWQSSQLKIRASLVNQSL